MNNKRNDLYSSKGLRAYLTGVMMALLSLISLAVIACVLISNECLYYNYANGMMHGANLVAVFAGVFLSSMLDRTHLVLNAVGVATTYFLVLLCLSMAIWGVHYGNVVYGVLSCAVGGVLGVIVVGIKGEMRPKRRGSRAKR